jgi:hypothetical protein
MPEESGLVIPGRQVFAVTLALFLDEIVDIPFLLVSE